MLSATSSLFWVGLITPFFFFPFFWRDPFLPLCTCFVPVHFFLPPAGGFCMSMLSMIFFRVSPFEFSFFFLFLTSLGAFLVFPAERSLNSLFPQIPCQDRSSLPVFFFPHPTILQSSPIARPAFVPQFFFPFFVKISTPGFFFRRSVALHPRLVIRPSFFLSHFRPFFFFFERVTSEIFFFFLSPWPALFSRFPPYFDDRSDLPFVFFFGFGTLRPCIFLAFSNYIFSFLFFF